MPPLKTAWNFPLPTTSLALTMAVNGLVTGLIVFRIFKLFLELKATSTSVEGTLGLTASGATKFRHIIFVIIESGMTLLVIQLVRLVFQVVVLPMTGPITFSFNYLACIGQMFNVIISSIHFYFFCFTEIFYLATRASHQQ